MKIKTTPVIRWNAYAKQFEKDLINFASKMAKSIEYHIKATLRKTGIMTYDSTPRELQTTIKDLFNQWEHNADKIALKLTNKQLKRLYQYVNNQYRPYSLKSDDTSKKIKEILKIKTFENIELIKSITYDAIKRYSVILYNSINNLDSPAIIKALRVAGDITRRKAKLIARDQTAKTLEALNFAKSQDLGLKYYKWLTSRDERVSAGKGGHRQLDGKIFKYDKPEAVIDSYGNVGHPAQRVNCRCTAVGVFLEPTQKIRKSKDGIGYEIVE